MFHRPGCCLLLGLLFFLGACRNRRTAISESPRHDLLQEAKLQGIKEPFSSDQKIFFYAFSRGGIRRNTLVLLPGAVFEVSPPVLSQTFPAGIWIGMPFQLGDGAELVVATFNERQADERIRLALDPVHKREDQNWRLLQIPLHESTYRVRFQVFAGPGGDATGDWIGLAPYP